MPSGHDHHDVILLILRPGNSVQYHVQRFLPDFFFAPRTKIYMNQESEKRSIPFQSATDNYPIILCRDRDI
jgi:hypothetical protein